MTVQARVSHSIALLAFIASLACQPINSDTTILTQTPELPTTLNGFRADTWYLPDDDLLGFVKIPAGPFLMGSDRSLDSQAFDNERWSASAAQGIVEVEDF